MFYFIDYEYFSYLVYSHYYSYNYLSNSISYLVY